jgi:hypothetical protein
VGKSLMWAAIGGIALLIVAVLAGGVLFVSGRNVSVGGIQFPQDIVERSTARRVDLDGWAATVCTAGEAYVRSITAGADQIDPASLELTARKDRAAKLGKVQVDSARALVTALRTVSPPEPALAYHRALIASAEDYIDAIDEQSKAIAAAAGAQQIAVANAQARFRLEANDREVAAIAVNLDPQVTAALERQPGCGPQPGAPGIAPPGGARPGGT